MSVTINQVVIKSGCMRERLGIPRCSSLTSSQLSKNPRVQKIRREAVVGPSETTRQTPSFLLGR